MTEKKIKKVFVQGAIAPAFVMQELAKHATKTEIGAHSIFLGQVRADEKNGQVVKAINYTAYESMAESTFHQIREATFTKYPLTCMHIYHSLGEVKTGEISLFVFTSSPHRRAAIDACNEVVERIKSDAQIWGEELFSDDSSQWKNNM